MTTFQQVELPAVQAGEQQKEKRVVNAPNGPPSHDDKTPLDDVPAQRRAEDVKRAGLVAADDGNRRLVEVLRGPGDRRAGQARPPVPSRRRR